MDISNIKDFFEYTVALINEFGKKFGISDAEAFRYMRNYEALSYVQNNYEILHTLTFDDVVESVSSLCRRKGGAL